MAFQLLLVPDGGQMRVIVMMGGDTIFPRHCVSNSEGAKHQEMMPRGVKEEEEERMTEVQREQTRVAASPTAPFLDVSNI